MAAYNTLQEFLNTLPSNANSFAALDPRYSGPGLRHIVRWLDISDDSYLDRTTHVVESEGLFYVWGGHDAIAHAAEREAILDYALNEEGSSWIKVVSVVEWSAETETMLVLAAVDAATITKFLVARHPTTTNIVHIPVADDFRLTS